MFCLNRPSPLALAFAIHWYHISVSIHLIFILDFSCTYTLVVHSWVINTRSNYQSRSYDVVASVLYMSSSKQCLICFLEYRDMNIDERHHALFDQINVSSEVSDEAQWCSALEHKNLCTIFLSFHLMVCVSYTYCYQVWAILVSILFMPTRCRLPDSLK